MIRKISYILLALNIILIPFVFSQEVGIPLGEETVVIKKEIRLKDIRYDGLDSPGNQKFYVEYTLNGAYRQQVVSGYELYDFYMNKWNNADAIKNIIAKRENINLDNVTVETMEHQFVAGLPTEPESINVE